MAGRGGRDGLDEPDCADVPDVADVPGVPDVAAGEACGGLLGADDVAVPGGELVRRDGSATSCWRRSVRSRRRFVAARSRSELERSASVRAPSASVLCERRSLVA